MKACKEKGSRGKGIASFAFVFVSKRRVVPDDVEENAYKLAAKAGDEEQLSRLVHALGSEC